MKDFVKVLRRTEITMAPEEEAEQARKRTEELARWARSPFPPAGEGYPLHQMGADGKRKARYKRKEQHDSGHFHTE